MKKMLSDSAFGLVLFSLLCASPAQAYLDGATISLVLQAATGAIASALLFGKIYWSKLKSIFARTPTNDGREG